MLLFWRSLGEREADRKKTFKKITLPPRVASIEDNDRDLRMYCFSGAHLPTGLLPLLSLDTSRAKVKESDQYQRYKCQRKKIMTVTTEGHGPEDEEAWVMF